MKKCFISMLIILTAGCSGKKSIENTGSDNISLTNICDAYTTVCIPSADLFTHFPQRSVKKFPSRVRELKTHRILDAGRYIIRNKSDLHLRASICKWGSCYLDADGKVFAAKFENGKNMRKIPDISHYDLSQLTPDEIMQFVKFNFSSEKISLTIRDQSSITLLNPIKDKVQGIIINEKLLSDLELSDFIKLDALGISISRPVEVHVSKNLINLDLQVIPGNRFSNDALLKNFQKILKTLKELSIHGSFSDDIYALLDGTSLTSLKIGRIFSRDGKSIKDEIETENLRTLEMEIIKGDKLAFESTDFPSLKVLNIRTHARDEIISVPHSVRVLGIESRVSGEFIRNILGRNLIYVNISRTSGKKLALENIVCSDTLKSLSYSGFDMSGSCTSLVTLSFISSEKHLNFNSMRNLKNLAVWGDSIPDMNIPSPEIDKLAIHCYGNSCHVPDLRTTFGDKISVLTLNVPSINFNGKQMHLKVLRVFDTPERNNLQELISAFKNVNYIHVYGDKKTSEKLSSFNFSSVPFVYVESTLVE
ncbi:MAG: hypothetical protein JXR95_03325 [Deltaproteobacteria bacterium]|nr:hypothetical protein [Deltaproteobacteria bacterium]